VIKPGMKFKYECSPGRFIDVIKPKPKNMFTAPLKSVKVKVPLHLDEVIEELRCVNIVDVEKEIYSELI
jgi:hypothetical protein